jgi:hypothetical protein
VASAWKGSAPCALRCPDHGCSMRELGGHEGRDVRIPRARWPVVASAIALFLVAPLIEAAHYYRELSRGAYPPEADSISIPIFQFTVGLGMLSPALATIVWAATRHYPSGAPLLTWSVLRPLRSWAWTVLFGAAALLLAADAVFLASAGDPLASIHRAPSGCIALILRASAVGGLESS